MNDEEFMKITNLIGNHLEREKVFIQNTARLADVNNATEIAYQLFPDAEIKVEDDPIQMGAAILTIKAFDLVVRETETFAKLIEAADNFEIFYDDKQIKLAILFANVLTMI